MRAAIVRGTLLTMLATALGAIAPRVSAAQAHQTTHEPPWRTQLMPWETHAGQPRPWRLDPRLARRSEPGYPDDFQVWFPNPASTNGLPLEGMWVRATAYDPTTDLFLGVLLNRPDMIHTVQAGDNVVFRVDTAGGGLRAVGAPNFADAGWPTAADAFTPVLRDGLRHYRLGNNGHVMPEIERCIDVLTPAIGTVAASATPEEQFVGHYVLGRCLAEKYDTERAMEQFRAAIALEPDDADSHMALLAELSLQAHQRPPKVSPEEQARSEKAFLDELAVVRARFMDRDGVRQILSLVFDPAQEASVNPAWQSDIPRLRRIGYGVFRWKQR